MTSVSIDRVINAPSLPSLPAVAMEVLELARDPNVSIKKIASAVQNDQALAVKILKTVNSSFYGLSTPCPTIVRAMSYLGMNTVKSLVLGFSLAEAFLGDGAEESADESPTFSLIEHWRGTLYAAAAARELASGYVSGPDPDEGFTAALLQDVGMLACAAVLREEYAEVVGHSLPGDKTLAGREREAFGFDHLEVGHGLAERWKLPAPILASITHHDAPAEAKGEHMPLVRLVAVASDAAAAILARRSDNPEALAKGAARRAAKWFSLDEGDTASWLKGVTERAGELARLFHLPGGASEINRNLLAQAEEQQLEHQLAQQKTQDDLLHQALTDGLTGIANRKHFDMVLAESFETAKRVDGHVSVMILDADKFKAVNDTLGHQAGDAVLIQLAARVSSAVGERGTVARYGGEEFAAILPGSNLDEAGRVAERVRRRIEETPFDLSDVPCVKDVLAVTVSVGVCAREAGMGETIKQASTLLRGADKAVYAAKEAGRNNVKLLRIARPVGSAGGERKAEAAGSGASSSEASAEAAAVKGRPSIPSAPAALAEEAKRRSEAETAAAPGEQPMVSRVSGGEEPVVSADADAAGVSERAKPAVGGASEPRRDPNRAAARVLLVEDDKLQAKLVERPLAASPDFEVTVAYTASEALAALEMAAAERDAFHFILCDLGLPDLKGDELVRRVRALGDYRHTPIVMLSASSDSSDVALCLSAGANAFITKESIYDDPKSRVLQIAEFWSSMCLAA